LPICLKDEWTLPVSSQSRKTKICLYTDFKAGITPPADFFLKVVICESSSSVVQIEKFGCKDVEKMVGVLAVLLYSLNSCVIVFVK
jgi:hypothetical protein